MPTNNSILVCLPTYNEEESIEWMIDEIRATGLDMIVVDGFSTEKTVELAKKKGASLYYRDCFGKGCAVKKALAVSRELGYDHLALIDCDTTYLPSMFPQLIEYLPDYDMVIGARSFNWQSPVRDLTNRLLTWVINLLFKGHYKDINSGMRIMKTKKFIGHLDASGFEIEAQISIHALQKKLKIKEVPISLAKRRGKSKVTPFVVFSIIQQIMRELLHKKYHN